MLAGFALLFLCAVALLAIPLDLVFLVERRESLRGSLSFGWMFGLVRIPMPSRKAERKPRKKPRKKRPFPARFARRVLETLQRADFRRRLLLFFKDALRAVHIRRLALRLRFGLDDPADTGMLWGAAGQFMSLLPASSKAKVDVGLSFEGPCLEFDATGRLRLFPVEVLLVAVLFLFSPATLRAAWALLPWGHQ
jgi:hypothetical protein